MVTAPPATRPTTTINIGGIEYTATRPKSARWEAFALVEDPDGPQFLTLVQNWLRAALGKQAWDEIWGRIDDDDGDPLDTDCLYDAFVDLLANWRDDMNAEARKTGINLGKALAAMAQTDSEPTQATEERTPQRVGSRPTKRSR